MKRSAQIGLLVMGALATTGAAGYFANNHDQACQARAANTPQQQPSQDCRRSVWRGSGSGYSGSHGFYSGSSSSSGSTATPASYGGSAPVSRGGFGGFATTIAHAFSGS